jgi:ABC-2 type transport system permease protein
MTATLTAWQIRYELRAFFRNRRRAIFSFAFPVMFLLVFGTLNQGQEIDTRGNISYITFYVPGIMAYAILVTTFNSLAMTVSGLRARGVLKRIRTTPLPWSTYVLGLIGSTLLVMLGSAVVLLVLGAILGADVRTSTLPGLAATIALGSVCLTTLGIAAARLIPTPESGMPALMIVTLPITFISNVFFPLDGAPGWLNDVAKAFPLRPLADGLQAAFDPRTHGAGFVGHDLVTLAIWTVLGSVMMMRFLKELQRNA